MSGWVRDVRIATRGLTRHRGWALAVLATLALGTGAATALFSVAYAVLAKPLPYPEPDRLVRVYMADPQRGATEASFSMPDWEDWRAASSQLEQLALYSTLPSDLVLTGYGDAAELETAYVTSGFFEALGVSAALGRTLRPEEERGDNRVVVLSHGLWTRVFGSDEAVIGTTILLKNEPYRVVGVMPPGFGFPVEGVEVYAFLTVIPPSSTPLHLRNVRFLDGFGRLAPEATPSQAASELASIASGLAEEYPDTNESLTGATVRSLRETQVAGVRPGLLALLAGAVLLLLVACANVAGLMLVRQAGRSDELLIRASLGAGRGRLARHALIESGVVAAGGALLGLAVATLLTRFLLSRAGDTLPRASEVAVDGSVFLFTAVLAVGITGLIGLVPARDASRRTRLTRTGEGTRQRTLARRALVTVQMAVATVILISAGLMVRSLGEMSRVDPGFSPDRQLVAMVNISSTLYPEREDYMSFYRTSLEALGALPGVESVGSMRYFPTRGVGESYSWQQPGVESPDDQLQEARILQVDGGLPNALGMRLRDGRFLTPTDVEGTPGVMINQTLAELAFPGGVAVGEALVMGGDYDVEVVGVVDDVRQRGLGFSAEPTVYVSQEWSPRRSMAFVIRTVGDPLASASAVRERLRALDPDQPLAELTTGEQVLSGSLSLNRFLALISGTFGVLSTALAVLGAAGLVAHAANSRTREIGIRVTLGEQPQSVSRRILRLGLVPIGVGLGVGVVVVLSLARVMRVILFGVAPHDGVAVVGSVALLFFASLLACYIPARRAASLDPALAMRTE